MERFKYRDEMKKIINTIDKLMESKIVSWVMVIIGSSVFGILCAGKTIWLDEALTGTYIRKGWWELVCFTATDVHPPLYYLIVKMAVFLFGDHIYVIKFFSYIPFIFSLILTTTKVRKVYGDRMAFVLLAMLCTTPCIIDRNVEMRMYQWAFFFVYAFAIYLFEMVRDGNAKNCFWALTLGVCAAYTHYYALIAVAILYMLVFAENIVRKVARLVILRNILISSILYFPWLKIFFSQARELKESGWWQEGIVNIKTIYDYIVWPFKDNTGYEPAFFILLLFCVILYMKQKAFPNRLESCNCIGVYIVLITIGFLIITLYQPVFITRFIYPVVGVLLLGIAIVVSRWKTEYVCLICVLILFFGAKTYNSQLHYQFAENSIPALENIMEDVDRENSIILCDEDAVKCIVEYLFPNYTIENISESTKLDLSDKKVYFFICNSDSMEENKFKKLEDIYIQYHAFTIYQ